MLIGIDIVDIQRIQASVSRTPRFLQRVFTEQERSYCLQKKNPYPSLAARFAAKEAVRKLDEVFISGFQFHDVEVIVDPRGKPQIVLHGKVLSDAAAAGIGELVLSLSHSKEQAIAVVCADQGVKE